MGTTAASVVRIRGLICALLLVLVGTTSEAPTAAEPEHLSIPNGGSLEKAVQSHDNTTVSITNASVAASTNGNSLNSNTPLVKIAEPSKGQPVAITSHVLAPNGAHLAVDPTIETSDAFATVVYVVVGLTIVIMIYMVIKSFRNRYATVRAERYGVRRRWKDQEFQPLGRDDDDEDTLFEARGGLL